MKGSKRVAVLRHLLPPAIVKFLWAACWTNTVRTLTLSSK